MNSKMLGSDWCASNHEVDSPSLLFRTLLVWDDKRFHWNELDPYSVHMSVRVFLQAPQGGCRGQESGVGTVDRLGGGPQMAEGSAERKHTQEHPAGEKQQRSLRALP